MSYEDLVEALLSESVGHKHPHTHDEGDHDEYRHDEEHVHMEGMGHALSELGEGDHQFDHHRPDDHWS